MLKTVCLNTVFLEYFIKFKPNGNTTIPHTNSNRVKKSYFMLGNNSLQKFN